MQDRRGFPPGSRILWSTEEWGHICAHKLLTGGIEKLSDAAVVLELETDYCIIIIIIIIIIITCLIDLITASSCVFEFS
jgi:hypothetical protein